MVECANFTAAFKAITLNRTPPGVSHQSSEQARETGHRQQATDNSKSKIKNKTLTATDTRHGGQAEGTRSWKGSRPLINRKGRYGRNRNSAISIQQSALSQINGNAKKGNRLGNRQSKNHCALARCSPELIRVSSRQARPRRCCEFGKPRRPGI